MKVVENPNVRTLSAKVPEGMYQGYRRTAQVYGTTVAEIVREALTAYARDGGLEE